MRIVNFDQLPRAHAFLRRLQLGADIALVAKDEREAAVLARMELQFAALRCEAQHNGRICSGDVTHGFATCEGSRMLCLLGAAVKEAYLLAPDHLTCAGCKRSIAACWRLVELPAPQRR